MAVDANTKDHYNSWAEYLVEYRDTLVSKGFSDVEAFTLVRDLHHRLVESGVKPVWMKNAEEMN